MTTTITRSRTEPEAADTSRLTPIARRRRPALAVGSLALVVTCIAVFVSVYLKAGHEVPVLVVAKTVSQGQMLTASDIAVARWPWGQVWRR